jgi:hypothetical protein
VRPGFCSAVTLCSQITRQAQCCNSLLIDGMIGTIVTTTESLCRVYYGYARFVCSVFQGVAGERVRRFSVCTELRETIFRLYGAKSCTYVLVKCFCGVNLQPDNNMATGYRAKIVIKSSRRAIYFQNKKVVSHDHDIFHVWLANLHVLFL